jgi:hypothetical protein
MTFYVITNGAKFDLVKVLPSDDANFLQDYDHLVQAAGPDMQQVLHRYAVKKAQSTKLALTLHPKLTRVNACYKNHQVLQIQSYYRLYAGWIPCSRRHPVNGAMLTWLEQLAIAITAGATKIQLALVPKKGDVGRIIYADFTPQEILE